MPVTARVSGTSGAELRYLAGKFYKAADRDLTRALARARRDAVAPLQKEIRTEALASLPKRGGYNATMAKAVKVSATGGTASKKLVVRIYARGKSEERDVRAVNAGELRHPVFGHWRKKVPPTRVRRGFVDRPVDKLADRILELSAHEVTDLLKEIARK
jgi:hypothetical protein